MKKTYFVIISLTLIAWVRGYAYDNNDFQVWNTDVEEFQVNKDSKIVLEEEFRWADNAGEFYYQHYDIGFFYNLEKYLQVGGGYRHIYELKKGKFKLENEPYVAATLFWDLLGCKFDDRNRLEYRHFDYQDDLWRYRNKFAIKLPWKFTRMELQPYLSDEIFISFDEISQFNQNRFSCGLGMNLTSKIKAEVYYMLQSTKGPDKWLDANVLGTKIRLVF